MPYPCCIFIVDYHLFLKTDTGTTRTLRSMIKSPVCLEVETVSLFLRKMRLLVVGVLV